MKGNVLKRVGCAIAVGCLVLMALPSTGYCQDAEIKSLIEDLGNSRDNWKIREKAVKALVKKRSKGEDALIAALKNNSNYRVRRSAAEVLGTIRSKKAIKPLIVALGEKDEYVRGSAASALAQIGSSAVDPLISATKSKSWMVRLNAAWALGELGNPKAVAVLEKLVKSDPDSRVPGVAKKALRNLK